MAALLTTEICFLHCFDNRKDPVCLDSAEFRWTPFENLGCASEMSISWLLCSPLKFVSFIVSTTERIQFVLILRNLDGRRSKILVAQVKCRYHGCFAHH